MRKKDLRAMAEEKLLKENLDEEGLEKLSSKEVSLILHDLKVHQIELEMQNEQLKKTQIELDDAKARYFDLYDLAPEGYIVVSEKGLIMESNLTAAKMLGYDRNKLIKQNLSQYILSEDQDIYYLHRKHLFESLEPQKCQLRMLKNDGTLFWGHMKATISIFEGQTTCRLILSDITDRKQMEEALALSEEKYKSLVMPMEQGLALHEIIFDDQGRPVDYIYIAINDSYAELLDVNEEMCIGKKMTDLTPLLEQYWLDIFDEVALSGKSSYYENYLKATEKYYSIYAYAPKKNLLAVLVSNIDDRVKREEEINYLNYHDQLTGLYNRRFYEKALKRLDTQSNLPLTIAMGDVNGLKMINDSFGHTVGDDVLKKVAEIIKESCEKDDIVARIGGDEFIIIMPHTDTVKAEKSIARMKKVASKTKVNGLDISISFGHTTKTAEGQIIEDIFIDAEDRMYSNKIYESSSIKSKMIDLIMTTLHEKNPRERLHSKRTSEICEFIAQHMDFCDSDISKIRIAGLMHDIGKIGTSESVLNNSGKLDEEDWKELKRHPEISYHILSSCNEFSEIATFALEHHERWDGKGYPKGLKGGAISIQARIIAIADAFDAMTNFRTYKDVLSEEEALAEIAACAGTQFDPNIAKIFVENFKGASFC